MLTRWLLVVGLVSSACATAPGTVVLDAAASAFVHRHFAACGRSIGAPMAALAESQAAWRELRRHHGLSSLPDDWFAPAVERAVVVLLSGLGGQSVTVTLHSEEGVDVLTVGAAATNGSAGPTLVLALAVPQRSGQLAAVARLPTPDGSGREATLAVFDGRSEDGSLGR